MILTEEEAKKKVCKRVPICTEVETSGSGDGSQRRFYELMPIMCIASDCMAGWRWSQYEGDNSQTIESTTHGYCGLGGKP